MPRSVTAATNLTAIALGLLPICHYNSSWREPREVKPHEIYTALTCDYYGLAPYPPSPRYPARQESADFNCSSPGYAYLFYGRFQGPFPGLFPSCRRYPLWCPISDLWSSEKDRLAASRVRATGAPAIDYVENATRHARERLNEAQPRQTFSTVPCSLLRRCPGFKDFEFFSPHSRRLLMCMRHQRLVMLGDSTLAEVGAPATHRAPACAATGTSHCVLVIACA